MDSADSQRTALRGQLSSTRLIELLVSVEASGQSAEVRIRTKLGLARVWFHKGRLIDVEMGAASGELALGRLIGLDEGRFEVQYRKVDRKPVLEGSVQRLFQRQGARQSQWQSLVERIPSLNGVMVVDATRAASLPQPGGASRARLLELFDGKRCVLDVIDASDRDAIEVLTQIVELSELGALVLDHRLSELPPSSGFTPAAVPRAPKVPTFTTEQVQAIGRGELAPGGESAAAQPNPVLGGGYSVRPVAVDVVYPHDEAPATRRGGFAGLQAAPANEVALPRPESIRSLVRDIGPSSEAPEQRSPAASSASVAKLAASPSALAEAPSPSGEAGAPAPRPEAPAKEDVGEQLPMADGASGEPRARSANRFVGRYEVLCRLGRGGMGSVYLCRVTGEAGFRRLFALKVLRHRLKNDPGMERLFLKEAYVAARLHHPNVVAVVDAAVHGAQPYLVMDYVEGCSFQTLLSRSPTRRPPELIASIIIDALSGLHAAHTLTEDDGRPTRLVHCDVSPENLLVGVDGCCRVADFGVARIRPSGARDLPYSVTRGKAGYISPEQASGASLDCRSDVFSLGVVLYNALTGLRLFQGDTVQETLEGVVNAPIERPSLVGLRPPEYFDRICLKALERDPDRRYASAEEMMLDLKRAAAQHGLLVAARSVGDWVRQAARAELQLRRLAALDGARQSRAQPAKARALPSAWTIPPDDGGSPDSSFDEESVPSSMGTSVNEPTATLPPVRSSRWTSLALVLAAVFALAAIIATFVFPDQVAEWFKIDTGSLPPTSQGDALIPAEETLGPQPSLATDVAAPASTSTQPSAKEGSPGD